ncbi:MAG: tRNA preQ1(34) S-adenosylmethionine ribosyltransferase-isomerase QueA [Lachnospiraceae bacterium]|nr:tRNA preQ1(34) S-adenosylmethionine ribosyltransferase-isomerase QueA [Lachnospiraceae bacterium]
MDAMKKSDYYYDLPEELIAQDPLEDRSSSRLLVLDKKTGSIRHTHFTEVIEYLKPGDCMVINNTKVIPARLIGTRIKTGTFRNPSGTDKTMNNTSENTSDNDDKINDITAEQSDNYNPNSSPIEILLLKRLDTYRWECIVRPGKKLRSGALVSFGNGELTGEIEDVLDSGNRIVRFDFKGIFEEILDRLGSMPLPPYIKHKLTDPSRYNTVYAKFDGSAAAPTAGLHFTPELLQKIRDKGVDIAEVTLHVGLGTFRPVKEDNILDHKMHSEFYIVTEEAAGKINRAKETGHRVFCVGTTSCRTVESAAVADDINNSKCRIVPGSRDTDIFIYPGYEFKICDCLITNFHLPESTLIMLVSALAGREHVLAAYGEAVKERYRFYSFGDAMLVV